MGFRINRLLANPRHEMHTTSQISRIQAFGFAAILSAAMTMSACSRHANVQCTPATQLQRNPDGTVDETHGADPAGIERCGELTWNRVEEVACSCDPSGPADSCGVRCRVDDDCTANRACLCAASAPTSDSSRVLLRDDACFPAECRSSADCAGQPCGIVVESTAINTPSGLMCRHENDECQGDGDCFFGEVCLGSLPQERGNASSQTLSDIGRS